MQGVRPHQLPLVVVERAGLVQDAVGDRDLADVVQLGGPDDRVELLGVEARAARPISAASLATPLRCAPSSGSRSRRTRTSTSCVWRCAELERRPFAAYMRVSAARSAAVGIVGLGRQDAPRPRRRVMRKPSPCSLSAAPATASTPSTRSRSAGDEHAELVAAEAERPALRRDRRGEAAGQPAQQQVARGMAEAVVVGLEAVEVEDREDRPRA